MGESVSLCLCIFVTGEFCSVGDTGIKSQTLRDPCLSRVTYLVFKNRRDKVACLFSMMLKHCNVLTHRKNDLMCFSHLIK